MVVTPAHIQIVHRIEKGWGFTQPKRVVHAPAGVVHDSDFYTCRERQYGLTKGRIELELTLLNGGKVGWYIADMKDKLYYYCGLEFEDVKAKLVELGLRPPEPDR